MLSYSTVALAYSFEKEAMKVDAIALWPLCVDAARALSQHYVPVMEEAAAEHQLSGEACWLLLPALTFEPETISAERLRIRSPYTASKKVAACLEKMAELGFIFPVNGWKGAYLLSDQGHEALDDIVSAAYTAMAGLLPIPPDELEALSAVLWKLVCACEDAPEPPGKWSLWHSRQMDPGEDAPVIVQIDQYLSDLAAYRDDAHLAAWEIHDLTGHAWEIVTHLWRSGTMTLADLTERLAFRGFSPEDHRQTLETLMARGWADASGEEYYLTRLGSTVREAAEVETDRYFSQPWACLSDEELADLQTRLIDLVHML